MRCVGNLVGKLQTLAGRLSASRWAFLTILVYTIVWFIFDRESLNFHGLATLATWSMTLVIQRAEHRDTQALHAKLDELLKEQGVNDELTHIDEAEPEAIERFRDRQQREHARGRNAIDDGAVPRA
jgi:low affinity Fe/Cu permease